MESRDVDGRPRCRYISTGIPLRLRTVHSALLHAPHHLHHPHTPSELFGCDCRLYLGGIVNGEIGLSAPKEKGNYLTCTCNLLR